MFLRGLQLLRSLQWRLVFIFILITVALMISASVSLNYFVEASYYDTFKKRIEKGFSDWQMKDEPTKEELIVDLRDNKNAIYLFLVSPFKTYTIINKKNNEIVYSSEKLFEHDKARLLNEIQRSGNYISALAGKVGDKGKLLHFGDKEYFDYALKKGDFVLYFRYDKEEWIGTVRRFNEIIRVSSLIAIVVTFVIGYLLSKTITVPIVNLMHKTRKIASGDFDQILLVKGDDEIGKLTKSFNFMTKELKNTLTQISMEKNKIETILNYLTDGVIAFDVNGSIIHSNPASEKMLNIEGKEHTFDELAEKFKFGVYFHDILYIGLSENIQINITVSEKIMKIYFATFTDKSHKTEGIIVVLQDITEQEKLENMRREFVANVSHELRTPLTSIKSYAETLIDGALYDYDTAEKFLNVIDNEADRMSRLVKDLLQLSQLDNSQMKLNLKLVSVDELVDKSIEHIKINALNKNQKIESHFERGLPQILLDYDRFEQVILNILSNAIKYTPVEGQISIYIQKIEETCQIKVKDNGIGIPKEDLPRIFERFYRVDKARSRELGGTGLGLSIAKQIVEAHNGTISIDSEFSKGTEVIIKMPYVNKT